MRRTQNFAGDNGNAYAEMEDPVGVRKFIDRESKYGKPDKNTSKELGRFTRGYAIEGIADNKKAGPDTTK